MTAYMTAKEFKKIRLTTRKKGALSFDEISCILNVSPRQIRRYEDNTVPVSGPVARLMELLRDGVISWNSYVADVTTKDLQ